MYVGMAHIAAHFDVPMHTTTLFLTSLRRNKKWILFSEIFVYYVQCPDKKLGLIVSKFHDKVSLYANRNKILLDISFSF
jgi:hypothetical protein